VAPPRDPYDDEGADDPPAVRRPTRRPDWGEPVRPPGRPTKLTAELIDKLTAELGKEECYTRRSVIASFGITDSTFSKWMKRGEEKLEARQSKSVFAQLVLAVRAAEAQAQRTVHDYMREAAFDKQLNDRPMRWLAALRWPDQYREKPLKDQTGNEGPEWAKEIDVALVIEELEAKLASFIGEGAPPSAPAPSVPPTPDAPGATPNGTVS
jgi:transposase-like protein